MFNKFKQQKREYRDYKARISALPNDYQATMKALEKYFWNWAKGDGMMAILISVLEMFENAVADGSPVEFVVGEDIAEFADAILADNPEETWLNKQRNQLRTSYKNRG
ncbi:hypothetical protein C5L31_000177 [Secundilactobacillus malefermentans]|uniref:DUF1048 domain-containing protein n=1 Tax=Secundilactobacillus malefermentans TaxID=176292 RepID=A0A4R5NMU2_9LACO|nr:DUF1048 domain-containing protein [Secundilactobacillus malefermentans]KRM55208.1 hypothetical protein FD44_GL002024 [Secundilactobacillus malefermentans DSM 5705 = KCTC 3548]TDG77178.1 hypothetical protein C5L31_000177 [Secundilactobacillus malefermentans]